MLFGMRKNYSDYRCPYGYGWCIAPAGDCPHWQDTFCELDEITYVISDKLDDWTNKWKGGKDKWKTISN